MYDVTSDTITYHIADLPPVILLGVIGGILGSLYNFLMLKVLRVCSLVNEYVSICSLFLFFHFLCVPIIFYVLFL